MHNSDVAADIALDYDETYVQTKKHQCRMMREINKLTVGGGKLNIADYQGTVNTLLNGGFDSVINKKPVETWTYKVWDAAFGN